MTFCGTMKAFKISKPLVLSNARQMIELKKSSVKVEILTMILRDVKTL